MRQNRRFHLSVVLFGGLFGLAWAPSLSHAQIIPFESGGLKYQTLTKNGVTVMFAQLPTQVREYCILQVAVSNGSKVPWVVKPIDFKYQRTDGVEVPSAQPRDVVQEFIEKAGRSDVIKLISTYEMGLYGMQRIKSTNGYEQRRQSAQTELTNSKLRAAAELYEFPVVP